MHPPTATSESKEKLSSAWKRAGAYASILSALIAAIAHSYLPGPFWTMGLVLAMGLVSVSIFLFANRLETKELTTLLKAQSDNAGRLRKAIDARRRNARIIQEIGLVAADNLEVDTFIDKVVASMSRNQDFKQGLIALCDGGCQRLRFANSFGLPPADQRNLEGLDVHLDFGQASDLFVRALKSGRPVFLEEIGAKIDEVATNCLGVLSRFAIDTSIGLPLLHKKESLGLLIVGLQGTRHDHTTSDVNLLMGIASQIATGIVNARTYSQMQASERRYRLLAENVRDVIWVFDLESLKIEYISSSVLKTHGYTPDEIMALPIDQYLTPQAFKQATIAFEDERQRVETGENDPQSDSLTLELEAYHKNGTIIPIEVTAGLILDENGRANTALGISRDMSIRKKAAEAQTEIENKLQQAQKMESLGTMAGSIAHNFNNLLMVVSGNLEMAKEGLADPPTAAKNIQRAINATQRAADLSSMMLTYVGQLKKESTPVDLSQSVAAVLEKMDESKMANVALDMDLADPMPLVVADSGQMRQMISGLITNAIEALGKEKGRVRISTGSMHCDRDYLATTYLKDEMHEGMCAYVEVADTGCGMDAATLDKVFDPFFSTKFTGRGLGMAAVMGIIRSHDGAIKVTSKKNEGSVFTALFPLQGISIRKKEPVRQKSPGGSIERKAKTILLVDDEAMLMDIGSQFLKHLGYQVRTAPGGREALDMVAKQVDHVDCLLLDYTMPGMDGLETMQQIRKIRPDLKIIITSGYTRQQIEDRFADVDPPDEFIQKPFELKTLRDILDRTLTPPG